MVPYRSTIKRYSIVGLKCIFMSTQYNILCKKNDTVDDSSSFPSIPYGLETMKSWQVQYSGLITQMLGPNLTLAIQFG